MITLETPAAIETFKALVLATYPAATVELDEPGHADGTWIIDLRVDELFLPTEWSTKRGFGVVTTLDLGFGERPNEVYRSPEFAAARVVQIARDLKAGNSAKLTLARLRELHGLNQTELAAKLGVGQAAVSKLESRSEAQVGTLARAVKELGGELVLTVRFPTFQAELGLAEGRESGLTVSPATIQRIHDDAATTATAVFEAATAMSKAKTVARAAQIQAEFFQQQMTVAGLQTKELFELSTKVAKQAFDTMSQAEVTKASSNSKKVP